MTSNWIILNKMLTLKIFKLLTLSSFAHIGPKMKVLQI